MLKCVQIEHSRIYIYLQTVWWGKEMVLKNRDFASLSLVEFSGTFNILFHLSSSKWTILIITNVVMIS